MTPGPYKSTESGAAQATGIPVGATVTDASWHVALHFGPSLPFPTEREALRAALDAAEDATYETPGFAPSITIDLRWKMGWEQGTPDANGRTTHSSGIGFTVHRTTYLSPDDARQRLANMDAYEPAGVPLMRNGDTVTITGDPVKVTIL